mgnify:CR=1 FL=1
MDTTLLSIIAAIATAIGVKEIWTIWKKKLDIKANKNSKELQLSTELIKDPEKREVVDVLIGIERALLSINQKLSK